MMEGDKNRGSNQPENQPALHELIKNSANPREYFEIFRMIYTHLDNALVSEWHKGNLGSMPDAAYKLLISIDTLSKACRNKKRALDEICRDIRYENSIIEKNPVRYLFRKSQKYDQLSAELAQNGNATLANLKEGLKHAALLKKVDPDWEKKGIPDACLQPDLYYCMDRAPPGWFGRFR